MKPGDLQQRLSTLTQKAELVARKFQTAETTGREQARRISQLEQLVAERDAEVSALKERVGYLEATLAVAGQGENVAATRRLLQSFVRDIDRCISDLTASPLPVDTTVKT